MATKKTKSSISKGATAAEVRALIHEVLNFQGDTVNQVLASCAADNDHPLERDHAIRMSEVLNSAIRDAAFSVLASKKIN